MICEQEPSPLSVTDASVQTVSAVRDSQLPALSSSPLLQNARSPILPLADSVSHHSSSHDASVLTTDEGTLLQSQPSPWMAFPPQRLPRRSSFKDFTNQERRLTAPPLAQPPSSCSLPTLLSSGSVCESPRRKRVSFVCVSTLEDRRSTPDFLVSTAKPVSLEEDDASFQSWDSFSPRFSAQQRASPLVDPSHATTLRPLSHHPRPRRRRRYRKYHSNDSEAAERHGERSPGGESCTRPPPGAGEGNQRATY